MARSRSGRAYREGPEWRLMRLDGGAAPKFAAGCLGFRWSSQRIAYGGGKGEQKTELSRIAAPCPHLDSKDRFLA